MSETQNSSYSLLNQKEVDALVSFLTNKKDMVKSDVLNQSSIDKLIRLITTDSTRIITDAFDPFANVDISILSTLNFRKDETELCELSVTVDDETNYIKILAHNTVTGADLEVTPKLFNDDDGTEWGYSLSPTFFNRIALVLSFKYSTETHDKVCNLFAKHKYGSETYKLPEVYLPTNENLLTCLL